MAKPKRGPALFELLDESRLRRPGAGLEHKFRVVHDDKELDDSRPPAPMRTQIAPDEEIVRPASNPPGVQLAGDRLHLSLTPFTAAIGVFVLSCFALGVYFLGQSRGQKVAQGDNSNLQANGTLDPAQSVESVRQQPPASHLVESLFENKTPPAPLRDNTTKAAKTNPTAAPAPAQVQADLPPGPRAGWVRDYTYILAQEFAPGREQDARRAQEFLAARGFASEVVKLESGALQLITLEGYNHKDPAQKKKADEILKKQRAAGTEYFASGGGYKLEGYYKTLKKDRW